MELTETEKTLCRTYMMLVDVVDNLGVDPAKVKDTLAGYLFDHAVEMEWIEEPPAGDVALGDWEVPEQYRADFIELASSWVLLDNEQDKAVFDDDVAAFKTNPRSVILRFCNLYHIQRTTAFVMLVEPKVDEVTKKSYVDLSTRTAIERLIRTPDDRKRLNSTAQRKLCVKILAVIKAHDTKGKFTDLTLDDLLWIR